MNLRFAFEHVEPGGEQLPLAEGGHQRLLIDHRSTRGVDQHRRRLHQPELFRSEEVVGFGGQRHVNGYEVCFGQQHVELPVVGAQLALDRLGLADRVVVEHLHPEPSGSPGHRLPDPPETDDSEGLAVDILTHHHQRTPDPRCAGPEETIPFGDTTGGSHEERPGQVGGGLGQHIGRVGGENASPGALTDVDVVEPHRVVGDDDQIGAGGQELGVHLLGEEGDHPRLAGEPGEQLGAGDGLGLSSLPQIDIAAGGDGIHDGVGEPAGHQDRPPLAHDRNSGRLASMASRAALMFSTELA